MGKRNLFTCVRFEWARPRYQKLSVSCIDLEVYRVWFSAPIRLFLADVTTLSIVKKKSGRYCALPEGKGAHSTCHATGCCWGILTQGAYPSKTASLSQQLLVRPPRATAPPQTLHWQLHTVPVCCATTSVAILALWRTWSAVGFYCFFQGNRQEKESQHFGMFFWHLVFPYKWSNTFFFELLRNWEGKSHVCTLLIVCWLPLYSWVPPQL